MTVKFKFLSTDPYVREKLGDETFNVQRWQDWKYDYRFSFHTMHEAGWPCYLLEPGRDGQQLPKINLKDYTGERLGWERVVSKKAADDFEGVIAANLERFQKLAEKYYEGEETEAPQPGMVVKYTCTNTNNPRTLTVKLPPNARHAGGAYWANFKNFAEIPKCPQHRTTDCYPPVLEMLSAEDFAKVKNWYDQNGELHIV